MKKILVSTISFVNNKKTGSEIYTTFAKRLVNDVLTKTPWDVMVSTNRSDLFQDIQQENNERVFIKEELLENHKTHVGAFNQLLKFYAIKDIDSTYDYVLYMDCDAGFTEQVNLENLENMINNWESLEHDMVALRTDATYDWAENEFNNTTDYSAYPRPLFNPKFLFYGTHPEWSGAKLPSEHIFLVKNNDKLKLMAKHFEDFCTQFETQDENHPVTYDMEAFEIGVSAFLAGYNMGEMGWANQVEIFKVGFNANNWEKVKI
jgi:hypothetical protein